MEKITGVLIDRAGDLDMKSFFNQRVPLMSEFKDYIGIIELYQDKNDHISGNIEAYEAFSGYPALSFRYETSDVIKGIITKFTIDSVSICASPNQDSSICSIATKKIPT